MGEKYGRGNSGNGCRRRKRRHGIVFGRPPPRKPVLQSDRTHNKRTGRNGTLSIFHHKVLVFQKIYWFANMLQKIKDLPLSSQSSNRFFLATICQTSIS